MIRNKNMYSSRKDCVLYIILAFSLIYFSHDTLFFGTNGNSLFTNFGKIVPFILIFLLGTYAIVKRVRFKSNHFFIFLIFASLPLISCFINGETVNNYVYRFAITFAAFLVILITDRYKFLNAVNSVMCFLTIWSIAFFLVVNILPNLTTYLPRVVNVNGNVFTHSIFATLNFAGRYGFARNEGIFREPGVFMCYLALSILIELFVIKRINKKRLVIFVLGIVSTFSTAGMVILAGLGLAAIITKNNLDVKWKKWTFTFLTIGVIFVTTFGPNISFIKTGLNKLQFGSASYGSFYARTQSIVGNIRIFFKSPIFGIGRYHLYDTVLASQAIGYGSYEAVDNTNTFLVCFAAFGFLYGLLACYGAYRFYKGNRWKSYGAFVAFVVLFIALSNEDLGQNYLFFYVVLGGLLTPRKVALTVGEQIGAPCNA